MRKSSREFNFAATRARKVALKLSYFGQNYHGFTGLPMDPLPTIEGELFKALTTCKLIPNHDECDWSRCGRTDKGVSGFGQVVSLWIRTNSNNNSTLTWNQIKEKDFSSWAKDSFNAEIESELDYIQMLNSLLPHDIRILQWAPVELSFDARFSCEYRKYKYFFQKSDLDITLMQAACKSFIGVHDFRHFCKIDPQKAGTPSFFTRTIYEAYIEEVNTDYCAFIVKGKAFLWHQVRNMMAVLFLIGSKRESIEIINELLDLSRHPSNAGKPNYDMASDLPLILLECGFKDIQWILKKKDSVIDSKNLKIMNNQYHAAALKALQVDTLREEYLKMGACSSQKHVVSNYQPLMKRKRCDSLQDIALKIQKKAFINQK
jgi:tRNA pseudouridine38/39 synthase